MVISNIILIHSYFSFAGVSRSSSCVIAYLMKEKGMSLYEALNFTKSKRFIVEPNFGFMRQLQEYEKSLNKQKEEEKIMSLLKKDKE